MEEYYEEVDLREYLDVLLKRKFVVLGVLFVFLAGTAFYSLLTPKTYKVGASLEIRVFQG